MKDKYPDLAYFLSRKMFAHEPDAIPTLERLLLKFSEDCEPGSDKPHPDMITILDKHRRQSFVVHPMKNPLKRATATESFTVHCTPIMGARKPRDFVIKPTMTAWIRDNAITVWLTPKHMIRFFIYRPDPNPRIR